MITCMIFNTVEKKEIMQRTIIKVNHSKHKQVDDIIIETMQAQLNYGDNGESISKEHLEGIKRLKEIFED